MAVSPTQKEAPQLDCRVQTAPAGDANKIKDMLETPFFHGDTAGAHNFQLGLFSPSRSIATTFPWALRLAGVIAWA
jgi:hypothetical protein